MKFSALTFAIAAAASASSVSAFGATRSSAFVATSKAGVSRRTQMNASEDLESIPGSLPTIVTDGADDAECATPAYERSKSSPLAIDAIQLGIKLHGGEKLRSEGLTGKGVKVAVIDSGVAAGHPDFDGQVVQQTWLRRGGSLMKDDHGTHVAGTIHMMAPDAEIYDYRVFGRYGMGINEAINTAISEAVEDGCDIINMSLGGPVPDWDMYRAMRDAHRAGVILVVAAGNEGDNKVYTTENAWPANFQQAISVAAVSKRDNLPVAYFSNTNSQVDYAGIGVDVVSFRPDGTYQKMSGTSMACPHVCGFITALMTKGGAYSDIIQDDASCRALLNERFCIDIATEGRDNATGLGFLTYLSKDEFEAGFLDLPDH